MNIEYLCEYQYKLPHVHTLTIWCQLTPDLLCSIDNIRLLMLAKKWLGHGLNAYSSPGKVFTNIKNIFSALDSGHNVPKIIIIFFALDTVGC